MDLSRAGALPSGGGAPASDLNVRIVVRQWSGRVGTGVALALGLLVVGNETLHSGWLRGLRALAAMAMLVYLVWLWWGSASLELDGQGVHIRNPLRRADLGWRRVQGATGAWGLTVLADGRKFPVWACPARGGVSIGSHRHPQALPSLFGPASTTTVSLDAQQGSRVVEECRLELLDSARDVGGDFVTTGWQTTRILVLAVLAVGLAASLLL